MPNKKYDGGAVANNFKSDDSFLRKLAVGAAGTNATIDRLKAMGFNPIELERGSTVVFEQNDNSPIDLKQASPVHFISVKDM